MASCGIISPLLFHVIIFAQVDPILLLSLCCILNTRPLRITFDSRTLRTVLSLLALRGLRLGQSFFVFLTCFPITFLSKCFALEFMPVAFETFQLYYSLRDWFLDGEVRVFENV